MEINFVISSSQVSSPDIWSSAEQRDLESLTAQHRHCIAKLITQSLSANRCATLTLTTH